MRRSLHQGDAPHQERRDLHGNQTDSENENPHNRGKQKICMQRPNRTFFRTTTDSNHAETNTAWKHQYLRHNFNSCARKAGDGLAKTSYGSPDLMIEDIPPNETFQAGGNLTTCIGPWTTTILGKDIQDKSGLGRWSGFSIRGKKITF